MSKSSRRETIETVKALVAVAYATALLSLLVVGWVDRMVGLSLAGRDGTAGFLGVFVPMTLECAGLWLLGRRDLRLDELSKLQGWWWRCSIVVVLAPMLALEALFSRGKLLQNDGGRRGG